MAHARAGARPAVAGPDELGIEIAPYCNGLAEAASELRRQLLDRLRDGDLERAETLMGAMDEIYSLLVTIDYPDGVTGGLRRTTDALRAVLERTRGDLTTAMVASRLQGAITSAQRATGAVEPQRAAGLDVLSVSSGAGRRAVLGVVGLPDTGFAEHLLLSRGRAPVRRGRTGDEHAR